MASNLFKLLSKIEDDRQDAINIANSHGFQFDNNSSWRDLMAPLDNLNIENNKVMDFPVYQRPSDWPDFYTILRDTTERDGYHTGFAMLIDDSSDTINFGPLSNNSIISGSGDIEDLPSGSFVQGSALGVNAVLTSDGEWYDLTNATGKITHTWDKSQDIVCNDGTYRYIIGYTDDTKRTHINYCYYNAIEIIIGDMKINTTSAGSGYTVFLAGNCGGSYRNSDKLVRFEILDIANGGAPFSIANNSFNPFNNINKVKEIILNNVKYLGSGNYNDNWFSGAYELYKFDAPILQAGYAQGDYYRFQFPSAAILNIPKYSMSRMTTIWTSTTPLLQKLVLDSQNVEWSFSNDMSFPFLTESNLVFTNSIPKLLRSAKCKVSSAFSLYDKPMLSSLSIIIYSGNYTITIGRCPRLRDIDFQQGVIDVARLDISGIDVNRSTIDNILNTIVQSSYNGVLKLGANIKYLTQSEIDEVEAKGWSIQ